MALELPPIHYTPNVWLFDL